MQDSLDFERLIAYLVDDNQQLSISRLYELSGLIPEECTRLADVWPTIPLARRRRIISHLVDLAEESVEVDFGPVFRIGLEDPDAVVREQSIEGLWDEEDVSLIPALTRLLCEDPAWTVRAAAATSLSRFVLLAELGRLQARVAERMIDALWSVVRNPQEDIEVRRRVVESLAYLEGEDVQELIASAYQDEEEKMRISAVFAMGRSADPRWEEIVLRELDSSNPEMRYEAARACGELQLARAVRRLGELIAEGDREIQEVSIWALGQIGGSEAERILEACAAYAEEIDDEELAEAVEEAMAEMEFAHGDLSFLLMEYDEEDLLPHDEEDVSSLWDDEEL